MIMAFLADKVASGFVARLGQSSCSAASIEHDDLQVTYVSFNRQAPARNCMYLFPKPRQRGLNPEAPLQSGSSCRLTVVQPGACAPEAGETALAPDLITAESKGA